MDLEHALYETFVRIVNEVLARKGLRDFNIRKKMKWKTKVLHEIEKRKEIVH